MIYVTGAFLIPLLRSFFSVERTIDIWRRSRLSYLCWFLAPFYVVPARYLWFVAALVEGNPWF